MRKIFYPLQIGMAPDTADRPMDGLAENRPIDIERYSFTVAIGGKLPIAMTPQAIVDRLRPG